MARYKTPQYIVTDNMTRLIDKNFKKLLDDLKVRQHFTSVEHPQTNGQTKVTNWVLLRGLKRGLEAAKRNWVRELPHVLWTYITTPHLTTGETPFDSLMGLKLLSVLKWER